MGARDAHKSKHSFTFSRVFDAHTDQSTVFDLAASEQVRSFLEGFHGLLFAYGTTSSGKTYTMQGTPLVASPNRSCALFIGSADNAGIIPRALSLLFNGVKHSLDLDLMPKDFADVVRPSEEEKKKILSEKESLLKFSASVPRLTFVSSPSTTSIFEQQNTAVQNGTPVAAARPDFDATPIGRDLRETLRSLGHMRFTFWISFAEIYNEVVYDLLDPTQCALVFQSTTATTGAQSNKQRNIFSAGLPANVDAGGRPIRRKAVELRSDKNGNIFLKGKL